jgi:hypothetical protein
MAVACLITSFISHLSSAARAGVRAPLLRGGVCALGALVDTQTPSYGVTNPNGRSNSCDLRQIASFNVLVLLLLQFRRSSMRAELVQLHVTRLVGNACLQRAGGQTDKSVPDGPQNDQKGTCIHCSSGPCNLAWRVHTINETCRMGTPN